MKCWDGHRYAMMHCLSGDTCFPLEDAKLVTEEAIVHGTIDRQRSWLDILIMAAPLVKHTYAQYCEERTCYLKPKGGSESRADKPCKWIPFSIRRKGVSSSPRPTEQLSMQ